MAIILREWNTEDRLRRGGKYFMTFSYWTNFNHKRAMSGSYEVLSKAAEGYWWFETTLTQDDLDKMNKQQLNRFLFQMHEVYNRGKNVG